MNTVQAANMHPLGRRGAFLPASSENINAITGPDLVRPAGVLRTYYGGKAGSGD